MVRLKKDTHTFLILCDACGGFSEGSRILLDAAVYVAHGRPRPSEALRTPALCPNCGARWERLRPGDEHLVGLSHTVTPHGHGRPHHEAARPN
jgi:hypothetical protein